MTAIPSRLADIVATTRAEVARRKVSRSRHELTLIARELGPPRDFAGALDVKAADGFALIAEIKRASPSKGLIRADFDPPAHALAYRDGGAACLSVLTDVPYFQGHDDHLVAVRAAVDLPILRKDFMIDPWQVAEARTLGADAILIIMAALDDTMAAEIEAAAIDLGMARLIEVHDEAELDRALRLKSRLIGINNRDLRSFVTDLAVSERLAPRVPPGYRVVAESGIDRHDDLARLAATGVRTFLVGEGLMRCGDLTAATRRLLEG